MRIKTGRLANENSLIDITYNKNIMKFQIDIVEYGDGGNGSKRSSTFYMSIDNMSLVSDDIVNTRFKNNWDNGNKLYLMGGGSKARDFSIEVKKSGESILLLFFIRNGESIKGKKGQIYFDKSKLISKSMTQQSLYDVRRMMKSIQDFIHSIDPEDRWKIEKL